LNKLQLDKVYEQFLKVADQKKEINDEDLPKIIEASNI
jgi:2-isopropylmalate synthase